MAKKGGAPENLDPVRTKDEAKKRGSNGGKKSGEARRRKRDAQQAARLILNLPVTSDTIENNLKNLDIGEEDFTNRVALFARAFTLGMAGDVKAMQFLIEMAGETPKHQLDVKRFNRDGEQGEKSSNTIDDWVNSIPDTPSEEDDSSGDKSTN